MYGAVELRDDVSAAPVARDDHQRTQVPRAHLAVQRLLDRSIPHEDQTTGLEVESLCRMRVVFLVQFRGANSARVDLRAQSRDLLGALLQGDRALGDELGGVELGDDGFEDFVADGGEDALVVVLAEVLCSFTT